MRSRPPGSAGSTVWWSCTSARAIATYAPLTRAEAPWVGQRVYAPSLSTRCRISLRQGRAVRSRRCSPSAAVQRPWHRSATPRRRRTCARPLRDAVVTAIRAAAVGVNRTVRRRWTICTISQEYRLPRHRGRRLHIVDGSGDVVERRANPDAAHFKLLAEGGDLDHGLASSGDLRRTAVAAASDRLRSCRCCSDVTRLDELDDHAAQAGQRRHDVARVRYNDVSAARECFRGQFGLCRRRHRVRGA